MAAPTKPKASDLTARQVAAANKKRDDEKAERAKTMSMATAAKEKAIKNEVVDLSDPKAPQSVESEVGGDVVIQEVDVAEKFVTIRVNEDIDMTYAGVSYKMEVGPKYKLPKHIADHLEDKGVVWH